MMYPVLQPDNPQMQQHANPQEAQYWSPYSAQYQPVAQPIYNKVRMLESRISYYRKWIQAMHKASNALMLDGLVYQSHRLTLRRPNTYDVRKAILMGPTMPDPSVDTSRLDIQVRSDDPLSKYDPVKTVQVRGLPLEWNYFQVKTFFAELKELEQFRLVTDRLTRASRGIAYCQFSTEECAREAVQQLQGKVVGRSSLAAVLQSDVAKERVVGGEGGPYGGRNPRHVQRRQLKGQRVAPVQEAHPTTVR